MSKFILSFFFYLKRFITFLIICAVTLLTKLITFFDSAGAKILADIVSDIAYKRNRDE